MDRESYSFPCESFFDRMINKTACIICASLITIWYPNPNNRSFSQVLFVAPQDLKYVFSCCERQIQFCAGRNNGIF